MIQDIFPHRMHNEYHPENRADEDSLIVSFRDNTVLLKGDLFPRVSELDGVEKESLIYLFSVDEDKHYYLLEETENVTLPEGYEYVNIRELRRKGEYKKYRIFAVYTAYQLANWYRNNKFCGRCGKRTALDGKERAIRCECGNLIYPRVVPAVIVGIINGDRLLVTKYNRGYANFALVAGFTEIGETLEETVAREAMEETGLKVKNIRYYKSQPWGIVDDLLAGFFCEVDGDDTIRRDETELKLAEWRTREDIELQPDNFSLTNEMMSLFKEGKI